MDTTGMRRSVKIVLVSGAFAATLAFVGCRQPVANNTAVQPTASPTPLPPESEKVEKPVNVSFSTYSTDWPVGWQWIDPDEKDRPTPKDVKKRVLRVRIPTGKDLGRGNFTAPRYIKPITGDFQIETRVSFLPKANYQGAGLLVYVSDRDFIRFERAYGGEGGGGEGIRVDTCFGGDYQPVATPDDIQTEAPDVELRILRSGGTFTAYWRENEDGVWREAAAIETTFPATVFTGLIAANTAREVTAEFAYIRLLPAPQKSN